MSADHQQDEPIDDSGELGGEHIPPTSKVRLPEHVTKLRKRPGGHGNDSATEADNR